MYRNIYLNRVDAEPINRGHDDESIQYGSFTYENLTIENCRVGRDPLIQLTCTSPTSGQAGHFRDLVIKNSVSHASVVDLGGGPRNDKLQNSVAYYFHDYMGAGHTVKVVSARFPDMMKDGDFKLVDGFTGKDVRAAEVAAVPFPTLLEPVDDLPPATVITSVRRTGNQLVVKGVAHDNGDVAKVLVNGLTANLVTINAGVVDWEVTILLPKDGKITAHGIDRAGNIEKMGHEVRIDR